MSNLPESELSVEELKVLLNNFQSEMFETRTNYRSGMGTNSEYFNSTGEIIDRWVAVSRKFIISEGRKMAEYALGTEEKLVIPDYPFVDDNGDPLWSKRAAKEGRKQVTQRYHNRKEYREESRTRLSKYVKELEK